MDVFDIVAEYLTDNGYDGLWNDSGCACQIGELAPCGEMVGNCIAGYLIPKDSPEFNSEYDFMIGCTNYKKVCPDCKGTGIKETFGGKNYVTGKPIWNRRECDCQKKVHEHGTRNKKEGQPDVG